MALFAYPLRRPLARRVQVGLALFAAAGVAAFAIGSLAGVGDSLLFGRWLSEVAFASAVACCGWRALTVARGRVQWLLITAALGSWMIGDVWWEAAYRNNLTPPWPSIADLFYLGFYPLFAAALISGMRVPERRLRTMATLDAAVGALVAGAIAAAFLYPVIRDAANGSPAAVATNLAYPVGDLVLIVLLGVRVAIVGGRLGRTWALLVAGLAGFVIADVAYLDQIVTDTYQPGTLVDAGWLAGAALAAVASLQGRESGEKGLPADIWLIVAPVVFGLSALGILVIDHFRRVNLVTLVLASLGMVIIVVRLVITFLDNRSIVRARERDMRTDPLTGLDNRRAFADDLKRELSAVGRHRTRFTVFLLDLDNFKYFNDTLGHKAGDDLIRAVAERVQAELRGEDVLARISGDEFAGVLHGAGPEGAAAFAERVCAAVRERPLVGELPGRLTVSVGVAVIEASRVPPSWEQALALADSAMYEAKERGRDRWSMADQGDAMLRARFNWSDAIRHALDDDRGFALYAQPIVDVITRELWGHELLLRYVSPDGRVSLPGAFLPEAERFGLMGRLDLWVVKRAAKLAASSAMPLTVNISGSSVDDAGISRALLATIDAAGVPPGMLVVEVTETTAIENSERAAEFAAALKGLGCPLALDDFGVGFASFRYLKEIPVDIVKIDGNFIRAITADRTDRLLTESIADVARRLGKTTVAEHVDSEACLQAVREAGVDLAQGFHLGRPVPVADALRRGPALVASG